MLGSKIKVDKNTNDLTITYKWFTLKAIFLIFFCIVWDSFLVFWYSMAFGMDDAGGWIMKIFPLAHVAVGVGLSYYTLCLLFNKTIISIDHSQIQVKHSPLPWKGNKVVEAENISQLYVKEKISRGKNGTTVSYQINALTPSDKHIKLIGNIFEEEHIAKNIEKQIEEFLGIEDIPIQGEHQNTSDKPFNYPRKEKAKKDTSQLELGDLQRGYILNYNLHTWEVMYQVQYDWNNGDTDKLFRISNSNGEDRLLYIQKEMGATLGWVEDKFSEYKTKKIINLSQEQIEVAGTSYFLEKQTLGKRFSGKSLESTQVIQWFYLDKSQLKSIRVLKFEDESIESYQGHKKAKHEFSSILKR